MSDLSDSEKAQVYLNKYKGHGDRPRKINETNVSPKIADKVAIAIRRARNK